MANIPRQNPLLVRHWGHRPRVLHQDFQEATNFALYGLAVTPDTRVVRAVNRYEYRRLDYSAALKPVDYCNIACLSTSAAPTLTVNPGFNEWFNPPGYRPLVQDWIAQTNIALTTTPVVVSLPPGRAHFDNPPLKKAGRQDYQDTLSMPLVLQPGPLVLPANNAVWPVPLNQRRNLADWQDYILPWAQAPPQANYDWPNPRGARRPLQDWTASTNIALTAVVVVTPPPPHQTDWPNPRGTGRHVAWQGWSDKLIVDILPPPANYDWPVTPARRRNPQDWIRPTPNTLGAAPIVPPPIAQRDWPVPRAARRNSQDWIWASNPASIPEPPVYLLRAATRYQYRTADYSAALKWCDNYNVALQTAPAAPPPPIAQHDWPVPYAARRNSQDWIWASNPASIPAPPTPPTVNPGFNEWFNPWGPRRGPQDWVQASPLALTVIIAPTLFRGPTIWRRDIPKSAAQTTPLGSATVLLAAPVVVTAPPPSNRDWPNPRGPRRHVAWEGWTSSLFVDVLPPPANYDWPNPTRRKPPVVADWTDWFKLPLQQVLPPRQTDWPVPKAPRRGPQDWIQVAANFVQPPPVQPQNALYDWPNPRGARRNPQDWTDSFKLPLQQVLPPTQKNWPLPTPAARRNPQDCVEPTNIALVTTVQIIPPIAQHDWPVPKGALQPVITARDFVAGFNPPVDPVYNPDNTLENEIRRIRDLTNKSGRIRYLKNEVRS